MVRAVGSKGYDDTTVVDVVKEAGVARATFYQHFEDKHECFLAAYDMVADQLLARVMASCDSHNDWLQRVEKGLATVLRLLSFNPDLARTLVVEPTAAGAEARKRHWDAIARFTTFLEEGRRAAERELPQTTSVMAAGAVSGLLFDELVAGRTAELPALLPDLLFALLVPYIGPSAAAEEMRRAAAAST